MKKNSAIYLTRGALIATLYVALTYLSAMLGLHNGVIQFRFSEILVILPLFFKEAVPGLAIGCLLANLLTGSVFWDILFGTLATLLGAIGTRLMKKLPDRLVWLSALPPIISNVLIVPPVLIFAYGANEAYIFLLLTVFIGEFVCCGIGGTLLLYSLQKSRLFK